MTLPRSRASSEIDVKPPHETLVAAFEGAARARAPYVTFHGGKEPAPKTAPDALDGALRWSKLLASRGVQKGDRVPILLPTGHAFVEALMGTMLLGAVPVPLATPMTFGSIGRFLGNLAAIAVDCGAKATVAYPRISNAVKEDASVGVALGELVGEADLDGVGSTTVRLPSVDPRDTAFLQYTSGTTGRPKGAVISHRAIVANAFSIAKGLDLKDDDVGVSWLPMFHDMGLIGVLLTSICHPYPVHVMSPEAFVMNPRRWIELVSKVGGTISAAPNFAYDMAVARAKDTEGLRLDTWRHALNGAEPVHVSTLRRFLDRFAANGLKADVPMPVYGLAEATLAVTFPTVDDKLRTRMQPDGKEAVSVGRPVAGMHVEIIGEDGSVVPEGTIGEIRVSGPSLMDGYYGNAEATAEILSDGRLRTGDLGYLEGGNLYVTGRAKEIIIKGGKNLYPYDVERVAGEVEGVRQGGVAAFGRANPETGTEDLVVLAETTVADEGKREAIAKAVRAELLEVLGIKPDDIRFCGVGKVPRTTSGKIRRRECARLVEAGEIG